MLVAGSFRGIKSFYISKLLTMNKLQLTTIACATFFYSCEKCEYCTRTWTYQTHKESANGSTGSLSISTGPTETFEVCSGDAIENAQKTITSRSETYDGNYKWVTVGTGKTKCAEKQ